MLTALITSLLTFILSGIIATRIAYTWQRESWIRQQRVLDRENEVKILRDLVDRFADLAGKRQHKMLRLVFALRSGKKDLIEKRSIEYDEILDEWNSNIVFLYAKLTMYVSWEEAIKLENIQNIFVRIGWKIEYIKNNLSNNQNKEIKDSLNSMNELQGLLGNLQKKLIKSILEKKDNIYKEEKLSEDTLDRIPTWKLFKSLFERRVKRDEIF
ncbi:hypothetical protein [Pleomorphomonas sp. PLEO]|uniref:hypothetical protein n=1 Tax=Pleomorphomonas sp. PLEO TaxID=3239306 RepID=UPI00351EFA8B